MQVWQLQEPFAGITSLPELYFRFRQFIWLVPNEKKKDFCELWQQHTLLKTMEMSNSNLNPLTKVTSSTRSTELRYLPMEHLSNDHEDHPNQHKNSHKVCNETGHPVLSLLESQWKLRQQYDQNFLMEGQP